VPAAAAAPEWVHGVNITYPTNAGPAYVNPLGAGPETPYVERQGDKGFKAKFDLTILGTQVDDVKVEYLATDKNGNEFLWADETINAGVLTSGVNARTSPFIAPTQADGWYDLTVCARDRDLGPDDWFCDTEVSAVLIDRVHPDATLIKPAQDEVISGQQYLLVGRAWDKWGLAATEPTWFDYCAITNWQPQNGWCGVYDKSWKKIATGTLTAGVPGQYQATWDSTAVPDDHGVVRFCAKDLVGHQSCDAHNVFVVNRFTVRLQVGWNQISTPLILYSPDIDEVLVHVVPHGAVTKVWTMNNANTEPNTYNWTMWTAADSETFKAGKGYWVYAKQPAALTFIGSFTSINPDPAAPPEYRVFEGWNLIGYTHWGQATAHWIGDKLVGDYIGMSLSPSVEALWRWDAWSGQYIPTYLTDYMVKGAGYWLALAQGGTLNP
jgi:hypothetical protein